MLKTGNIKIRLLRILSLFVIVILIGTLGYRIIEGWTLLECFYMTVITITTTGYLEVHPLSEAGRIFTSILIFTGVSIFFYGIGTILPTLIDMWFKRWISMAKDMENHYIVCGYGAMGSEIAKELSRRLGRDNLLVIDKDENKIKDARHDGFVAVEGDATDEETLREGQIEKAKGIVTCMGDSENAFTIMMSGNLNEDIKSIAISKSPKNIKNLELTNASRVLSPYLSTAKKTGVLLASTASSTILDIIEEIEDFTTVDKIEAVSSKVTNKTLGELGLWEKANILPIAIEREGKIERASPEIEVKKGDHIYFIGGSEAIENIKSELSS